MVPSLVVVGLGNPGKAYASTRHNIGWIALDALMQQMGAPAFRESSKFLCLQSEVSVDGHTILLVKPTTYMNRSGECVRKIFDFYKIDPRHQLLVIVDDIDLPLGTDRYRTSGGPGTHNGMKSIVETLGEDFPRLRIGIGPQPKDIDLSAWVLSSLMPQERESIDATLPHATKIIHELLSPLP